MSRCVKLQFTEFRKKLMNQSNEIKQKPKGLKNIDICFFVIFSYYDQGVISGRNTDIPEIFLIFPSS